MFFFLGFSVIDTLVLVAPTGILPDLDRVILDAHVCKIQDFQYRMSSHPCDILEVVHVRCSRPVMVQHTTACHFTRDSLSS